MPSNMRRIAAALALFGLCAATSAAAQGAQDARGLWLSADQAAVIEFKACADKPEALCGTIVWDKDAGTPADSCGVTIAKLAQYEDEAWRDGWVFDPRSGKYYKGVLRVKDDTLLVRAFIGTELLGETEQMTRAATIPAGCKH